MAGRWGVGQRIRKLGRECARRYGKSRNGILEIGESERRVGISMRHREVGELLFCDVYGRV